jgi:ATP-binding cassette subfamily B (MDR/TAP) protein 1
MPISWLDKPKNSSGALSARLASDCQTVNGLTTTYVSILIQNIATLAAGIIISFIYEWRTSLVALGLIPLMIISGAIQMQFTTGFSAKTDSAYKDSSSLIT